MLFFIQAYLLWQRTLQILQFKPNYQMLFGQGNRDQTCETCWKQLPFGYKFLFVSTLGFNALSFILPFLIKTLYFDGYLVVRNFQIWRLPFSFYTAGAFPFSILNILINFLWLLSIYPPLEKKFSTSFILVQTFLQNLTINLVLTVASIICYYIFSIEYESFPILSLGFFPLCMIFIWHQASQNPDQHTTFCCMPCLIPMKWIPVIILAFCLFFASNLLLALVTAFALGYLQFMHFKRRLIKLPVRFYRKIDSLLPKSVTDRPDYVKVQNVETELSSECSQGGQNIRGDANPFNRNQNQTNQPQESNKVEVIGKGVSIGGGVSNVQNFKGFWANKAQAQNQQIQIQPPFKPYSNKQQNQGIDPNFFTLANDSKLNLNEQNENSQQTFRDKQQKKVDKQNLLQ